MKSILCLAFGLALIAVINAAPTVEETETVEFQFPDQETQEFIEFEEEETDDLDNLEVEEMEHNLVKRSPHGYKRTYVKPHYGHRRRVTYRPHKPKYYVRPTYYRPIRTYKPYKKW